MAAAPVPPPPSFLRALNRRERALAAPARLPSWMDLIQEVYGGETPLVFERQTLAEVASPLVRYAERALREEASRVVAAFGRAPFSANTVGSTLVAGLQGELGRMLQRTLVLEMHVARLEERLSGDTSEQRFASFLAGLAEPGRMMRLFEEYPVLARVLGVFVEQAIAAGVEMLERLARDFSTLVRALSLPEDPGDLVRAKVAGDRHEGGRAVTMLLWESGAELVYKPKPLAADAHFQALIEWLDERGASPRLAVVPMVDRGDYGYSAVVRPLPCETEAEVGRFFERQGQLLALFYGLLATDFHCENVIASGEHPHPIDLESLFHGEIGDLDLAPVDAAIESEIVFSVLRVGLLPERARENGGAMGMDMSGLGGEEGQMSPRAQPTWEGPGTDQMRLVRRRLPLIGGENRPSLRGEIVRAFDWTESIVTGMSRMYRLLLDHREALCKKGGWLDLFAGDVVRIIARPTRVYASLLGESFHPDVLRDALDRDQLFDKLASISPGRDKLAPLAEMEREDLWRGDIPKLTARAGSRDLLHAGGRIEGFFGESGLALAERHLARLGPGDLAQQQWIVRASMVTLATDVRSSRWARYAPAPAPAPPTSRELVAAAERIGDRLESKAIQRSGEATWLGLAFVGERWVLAPLGTDLYGGLLGVALFLAQLGEVTGREKYRALGERAMAAWIRKERAAERSADSVGGHGGLGGAVYGLARLASLWNRGDLLELAHRRLALFTPLISADETLDVLSGSAGAIGALMACREIDGFSAAIEIGQRCAEHLLARAVPMAGGLGFPVAEAGGRALAGFSHGAAGIAWALLRLFQATGQDEYREAAFGALRYERSLFVPAEGNYYDLRPSMLAGDDPQFTYAWCHGAPGIGLARAAQLPLLDSHAREEVRITAETTLGALGRGHSACHGDLGNLELVERAAYELADDSLADRARAAVGAVVAHGERDGWLCGVPLSVETPSLMVGLAGMGYQLLRLAEPERVPSVLLLETAGRSERGAPAS